MFVETLGLSCLVFLWTFKLPLYPHIEMNNLSFSWEHLENLFLSMIVFLESTTLNTEHPLFLSGI